MKLFRQTVALVLMWGSAAFAQESELRLAVPEALEASGFAQYLVPRFSLKTSVRISRVPEGEPAQMRFGTGGKVLFVGLGEQWSFSHDGDPRAERFLDWLTSDVGQRTIESFKTAEGESFSTQVRVARTETETVYDGDAAVGEQLSLSMCGRCHVVSKKNRMNGMGSTPSFAVLRGFPDWDTRFATFHLLNPHPSFTQIEDVTEAFDPALPPPIVPLTMTLADLEAILAYVSGIEAADLGAPIQVQ